MSDKPKEVRESLQKFESLRLIDDVLYRTVDDPEVGKCNQLLIPESLKSYVLEIMHNLSGHQGIERTYALLKKRCYWLNMLIDIKTWIKNCERCLLSKNPLPRVRTSMGSLTALNPLQIVAIDFTLFKKSSDGRENVLIMTDVFFRNLHKQY